MEEKIYVAGAMAGVRCQVLKRGAPKAEAGIAYIATLRNKGIDHESTLNDREIAELSKPIYEKECK